MRCEASVVIGLFNLAVLPDFTPPISWQNLVAARLMKLEQTISERVAHPSPRANIIVLFTNEKNERCKREGRVIERNGT